MCGILAVIQTKETSSKKDIKLTELAKLQAKKLTHRGPDESGQYINEYGHILCHERLSIIDLHSGKQPIKGTDNAHVIHNGEIYNHQQIREDLKSHTFSTTSDSEVIVHLYEEYGTQFLNKLDGVFAFVIVDGEKVIAARDPIGVKPLFYGHDEQGRMWLASEYKALIEVCVEIKTFPPGHFYTSELGFVEYFKPAWFEGKRLNKGPELIKESFIKAVKKRLMSDVPLGVLLSGGLDSSLVASIVSKEMKSLGKTVHSFSVGLEGQSPDLDKAKEVADFLGTKHHAITFTVEEGLELIKELIYKLESYDVTSIRASTPMYIMSKYIKDQGVKVVLSGEGSDEMYGGYLYFANAPTSDDFHNECLRRVKRLHTSDVQRADRATMGYGLEARVPFLDLEFLKDTMELDPKLKTISKERMEKHVLRAAFDDKENPYLPESVLWRQKEQFSDGVGYSWIDRLKEHAEAQVSDADFANAANLFPHNTPATKEAFYYRSIYTELFPHKDVDKLVKRWVPKWQKDLDPSGRASVGHEKAYEKEDEVKISAVALA